jgi:hypothetical protein
MYSKWRPEASKGRFARLDSDFAVNQLDITQEITVQYHFPSRWSPMPSHAFISFPLEGLSISIVTLNLISSEIAAALLHFGT